MKTQKKKNQKGFGLTEVVVAIALMSLITFIIAELINNLARSTKSITSFTDFNMLSGNINQALGRAKGCLDSFQGGNIAAPTYAGGAGTVFNQQVIYQPAGPARPSNWGIIADGRAAPPAPYVAGGNIYASNIFITDIVLTKTLDLGAGHWVADLEIQARKGNATGPVLESKKYKVNMQLDATNKLTSCQVMEPAVDSVQAFACNAMGGNYQKLDLSIAAQDTIFKSNGSRVCTQKPWVTDPTDTTKIIPSIVFSSPNTGYDWKDAPTPTDLVYVNTTGIWSPQKHEVAIMANGQDLIRFLGDDVVPGGTTATFEGRVLMVKSPNTDGYAAAGANVKGNMRGRGANDMQVYRDANTQVASGAGSNISGGGFNTASANGATVGGGTHNVASGSRSTVGGGMWNEASCANPFCGSVVAGGNGNKATADFSSILGGTLNEASALGASVLGGNTNKAQQTNSAVVAGSNNRTTGNSAVVVGGWNNTASGPGSVASGFGNLAGHDHSAVFGIQLATSAPYQTIVGKQNALDAGSLFIVGIGSGAGTNGFVVKDTGDAEIYNNLKILHTAAGATPAIDVTGNARVTGTITATASLLGQQLALNGAAAGAAGSITGASTITATGAIAAGGAITSGGTVSGTSFVVTSDARLKTDFEKIENVVEKIMHLKGLTYFWKDKYKYGSRRQMGLLAQDVEKQFPEAVETGPDGIKRVNYQALVAPLIEVVKSQQEEINELKELVCLDHPNAKICRSRH